MALSSMHSLPKIRLSTKRVISPQIYEFLRKQITETNIKPGTVLSENSLSEHFKVSRQPVREALMRLSYEGFLSVLPQRGSIVELISISELKHTVFIRCAIEKECVSNFAKLDSRAQRSCLNRLEKVIKQQRLVKQDAELKSNYLRLDDLFHESLCAISGSPLAWSTIQSLKGQMDRIRFLSFDSVSLPKDVTHEHEAILLKLQDGDLQGAIDDLEFHLYQIIDTHKPIMHKYSSWFSSESLQAVGMRATGASSAGAASTAVTSTPAPSVSALTPSVSSPSSDVSVPSPDVSAPTADVSAPTADVSAPTADVSAIAPT